VKLILQRVACASVCVDEEEIANINRGILVLFGVEKGDGEDQTSFLADKTLNLRIFPDDRGKMNFSCVDIGGDILVVSQFTLAGDCSRGRRPGFDRAADPVTARTLYEGYVELLNRSGLKVAMGRFAADMKVQSVNDGPVTFLLER
jgi:D-tyrosyl-tRNA(Tyr) deacylase